MKKQSPGARRQEYYRWEHPQLNITFQNRDEPRKIHQACAVQHQTPREVLLAWADQILAQPPKP